MARPTLEELTADLDATAIEVLGDALTFIQPGSVTVTRGFVELGEAARSFGASAAIDTEIEVELSRDMMPERPNASGRLTIAALGSRAFAPREVRLRGTMWRFGVKELVNA